MSIGKTIFKQVMINSDYDNIESVIVFGKTIGFPLCARTLSELSTPILWELLDCYLIKKILSK